jgi:hypothetical protein
MASQLSATENIERALGRLPLFQGAAPAQLDARIFPVHFAPVVIEEGGRRLLRLALPLPSGRQSGRKLLSCAAITDEPPAELAAAGHERCIVNLARAAVDRWLAPLGRPAAELQALLDERERPYYEHEVPAA